MHMTLTRSRRWPEVKSAWYGFRPRVDFRDSIGPQLRRSFYCSRRGCREGVCRGWYGLHGHYGGNQLRGSHAIEVRKNSDSLLVLVRYSAAAKASGSIVVSSCAFDAVPGDMGVQIMHDVLSKNNGVRCVRLCAIHRIIFVRFRIRLRPS